MLSAVTIAAAGLYITWIRGTVGDLPQHIGATLNAVLIWLCAAMALRYAMARDFKTHRRWALRLFLVASAAWFLRLAFFLTLLIFKGPFGFDPVTFRGPFLTIMTFAQYLVPLAVLEVYLRAQDRPGGVRRMATAGLLFVVTLAMVAGIFAVSMAVWLPQVKAAYDPRKSIAETLSATIASSGVDSAVKQYHVLRAAAPTTYDFDEPELNGLGYQLIRVKKFKEAIRIFQLNVEAFPLASNTYDSLGEAYRSLGRHPQAIGCYQQALRLRPDLAEALTMGEEASRAAQGGNRRLLLTGAAHAPRANQHYANSEPAPAAPHR
jgi:tetratricopeptide (TPR) repeat protein